MHRQDDIREKINRLWGRDVESMEEIVRQMQEMKDRNYNIVPGIDANRIEGICGADTAYVKEFIGRLMAAGIDRSVLSWDIMQISKETIEEIAHVMPVLGERDGLAV